MRKLNQKVNKNDLNLLTMNDFFDGIFKYRKHLVEKEIAKSAKAPKENTTAALPNSTPTDNQASGNPSRPLHRS